MSACKLQTLTETTMLNMYDLLKSSPFLPDVSKVVQQCITFIDEEEKRVQIEYLHAETLLQTNLHAETLLQTVSRYLDIVTDAQLHAVTGVSKELCEIFLVNLRIPDSDRPRDPGPDIRNLADYEEFHRMVDEYIASAKRSHASFIQWYNSPEMIQKRALQLHKRRTAPQELDNRKGTKRKRDCYESFYIDGDDAFYIDGDDGDDGGGGSDGDDVTDEKRQRIRLPPLASLMTWLSLSGARPTPEASE
jgi:hypothetical protein